MSALDKRESTTPKCFFFVYDLFWKKGDEIKIDARRENNNKRNNNREKDTSRVKTAWKTPSVYTALGQHLRRWHFPRTLAVIDLLVYKSG